MNNVNIISLIAMLLVIPRAMADIVSIERSVFTRHADYQDWMNEDNNLVAIEYVRGDFGINISKFNNTYGNKSKTIGASYNVFSWKHLDIDLLAGAVKGYTKEQIRTVCSGEWCAYVAPRVTIKQKITDSFGVKSSAQLFGRALSVTVGVTYEF